MPEHGKFVVFFQNRNGDINWYCIAQDRKTLNEVIAELKKRKNIMEIWFYKFVKGHYRKEKKSVQTVWR